MASQHKMFPNLLYLKYSMLQCACVCVRIYPHLGGDTEHTEAPMLLHINSNTPQMSIEFLARVSDTPDQLLHAANRMRGDHLKKKKKRMRGDNINKVVIKKILKASGTIECRVILPAHISSVVVSVLSLNRDRVLSV